jgi:hypothetical protein
MHLAHPRTARDDRRSRPDVFAEPLNRPPYYLIDGSLVVRKGMGYPCPFGGCDLTVTNNLGSSVTVFLGKPIY